MKSIRISLTKWQEEMLAPLFEEISKKFNDGDAGATYAQVWNGVGGKPGFMDVRVIDSETGHAMQKAFGVKVGRMSSGESVSVRVPIDDEE